MGKTYLLIAALIICTATGAFAGNLKALSDAVTVRSAGPQFLKHKLPFLKPGMIVKADFQSDIDKETEQYIDLKKMDGDVSIDVTPRRRAKKPAAFGTRAIKRESRKRARGNKRESLAQVGEEDNSDALNMDIEKDLVLTPLKPGSDDDSKDIVVSPPPPRTEGAVGVTTQAPRKKRVKRAVKPKTRHVRKKVRKEQQTVSEPTVRHRILSRTIRKVRPLSSRPWSSPAGAFSVRTVTGDGQSTHINDSRYYKPVPPPKTYVRNGVMVKLAQPQEPPAQQQSSSLTETSTDVLNTALDLVGLPFAFVSSLF